LFDNPPGYRKVVTVMLADIINGAFELLGGFFILNHCRAVIRDRAVKGVSIISTIFFTSWGVWNLYYYPSLGQWWSFVGGLFIVAANAYWIALMLKYRRAQKRYEAGITALLPKHLKNMKKIKR
jgi:hypothetical protein